MLTNREFRLLEGLRLSPRRTFSGHIRGERLSRRKGISIEFADYRDYGEGDDLRHLDWNVLARLETPVIKTYQDEEDLAVYLLVDCSSSMSFGAPTKLETASRIACAIGYVGLCSLDAVFIRSLGVREKSQRALRTRANYPKLAGWAGGLCAESSSSLSQSLREFAASGVRPGYVFVISDGLDPDVFSALRIVGGRGHEIGFIQVLSDEEIDPDLEGDLRLIDSESGQPVEITAGSQVLKAYKQALEGHCQQLQAECIRIGGRYARTSVGEPFEHLFVSKLKREGWISA